MMKQTMKKTLGWLVVAAALTIGTAACSSDADSIAEPTIQEPAPTSLHITVGAGIANDNATTRADVVDGTNSDNKPTHTLKFTTGDRLYFWRYIDGNNLTGILTMDGEPTDDGLSATFSGDVKMYDNYNKEVTNYDYSSISNPLSGSEVYFIQSGAASGCFNEANHMGFDFNESYSIASDVNTLMKTALYVEGSYDDTQQRFNLTKQYPILNCALGGLTPNTAYTVKLRMASDQDSYESNVISGEITYASTVTTDGLGNARFAISGNHEHLNMNQYWVVQLSDGKHTKDYVIGQKTFEPKVYNLTRAMPDATNFVGYETSASFSLQFRVFAETYAEMNDISSFQAPSVTISGIKGRWKVTPTAPATYFSQSTSGLTAGIIVSPGETLTFTAKNVSFNYKSHEFVGTFTGTYTVPETIGASLNLGTVRMECADGAICTFIVNFNGMGWLTEITVSDGTNSKTLTDLTYDSGSEVTMLLPTAMNNKTLTVTATYRTAAVGGGTYTYVGTIPNATITADGPNDLGKVTLTKQQ
jgi:hypothetical protein